MAWLYNLDQTTQDALNLAETWQNRANELLLREEKTLQKQMDLFFNNPRNKVLMAALIDQSFRSKDPERVAAPDSGAAPRGPGKSGHGNPPVQGRSDRCGGGRGGEGFLRIGS